MLSSSGFEGNLTAASNEERPLKIAYLFMRYPNASQPFAISDVQSLSALGHQVDTYALSGRDKSHASLLTTYNIELPRYSHISLHTFSELLRIENWRKAFNLMSFISQNCRDWRSAMAAIILAPRIIEVAAELQRTKPDVIHAFWGHFPSLVFPLIAQSQQNCVTSLFLGAYDLTSHLSPFSVPAAKYCHLVWTHSEANRQALLDLGIDQEKIRVAHRGIPLDLMRGRFPPKERFKICTAANLQKSKNVDLVLKVFHSLLKRVPSATLTIIGDGEERDALRRLAIDLAIDQKVEFKGHLSRPEVFREMARANVFLFLSTKVSERLPNVVKEAMLAECHCIVSDTPGIRELIDPEKTGYIVNAFDVDEIATQVYDVLQQEGGVIGRNSAHFIKKHMSSEAAMKRYTYCWQEKLHHKNPHIES